jgi:tetratricopeptide (TPR) repeat protein
MSAGEFFDLVRPAFLILSALFSLWVLTNAQRNGFRAYSSLIWALATFFLPLVTIPLYLLVRLNWAKESHPAVEKQKPSSTAHLFTERLLLPFLYGTTIFVLIAISQYRDYNAIDAHLARAKQASLDGDRQRTIREYKAALTGEDNAHTHKLLGIEYSNAGEWGAALSEFRLAERGQEADETLPFRIAVVLDLLNQPNQAAVEYKRFLYSEACLKMLNDDRCEVAKKRLNEASQVLQLR